MGLYQKVLEFDRPQSYEQWKQAAINRQQVYMHMKARLQAHRGTLRPQIQPSGWILTHQLSNPNAMDMSAGRTRGRITRSEEINPSTMRSNAYKGQYTPRGGFMQQGRGGGRSRDIREVECYTCHQKGHFSCNCPQHSWNKSRGREAIVDDQSMIDEEPAITNRSSTQTPQQSADTWLRGVANEQEEV